MHAYTHCTRRVILRLLAGRVVCAVAARRQLPNLFKIPLTGFPKISSRNVDLGPRRREN